MDQNSKVLLNWVWGQPGLCETLPKKTKVKRKEVREEERDVSLRTKV